MANKAAEPIRTTVYLPPDLAAAADRLTREGKAKNWNELMIMGLRQVVRQYEREAIDADLEAMCLDEADQVENMALMEEFKYADAEATQMGELDG